MSIIRYSYINTGVKGAPIIANKPKLAIAFTAERSETGEQHVAYGISSCNPVDQFVRKTGRVIAESRLETADAPEDHFAGTVVLPKEVNLDQITSKIVEIFNAAKEVAFREDAKANPYKNKDANELYMIFIDKRNAELADVQREYAESQKKLAQHVTAATEKVQVENPELIDAINQLWAAQYGEPMFQ